MKKTSLLLLTTVIAICSTSHSTFASNQQEKNTSYCMGLKKLMEGSCKLKQVPIPSNKGSVIITATCLGAQKKYYEQCIIRTNSYKFPKSQESNSSNSKKEDN
ncbi:MAG: hypothetical protein BGO77_04885 [Caedibacter sp. 37-49]|nr:MAG: hypothetical protein BGO77_04885 [Caedibacter sp. 37-49]